MPAKVLLVLIFVLYGLMMIGISIPLLFRKIGPNRLYGLRVRSTFADEEVWYEANGLMARDMIIFSVAEIAVAIGALPLEAKAYLMLLMIVGGVGLVVVSIVGWLRANRLLRQKK